MRTQEVRKDKDLMIALEGVANGRELKLHNPTGDYESPYVRFDNWLRTSLYQVYYNPSETKKQIDEAIRKRVAHYFDTAEDRSYHYSGNSWGFTMETDLYYQPLQKMVRLKFTRENLHVTVW